MMTVSMTLGNGRPVLYRVDGPQTEKKAIDMRRLAEQWDLERRFIQGEGGLKIDAIGYAHKPRRPSKSFYGIHRRL
jgi:hypothetical protein